MNMTPRLQTALFSVCIISLLGSNVQCWNQPATCYNRICSCNHPQSSSLEAIATSLRAVQTILQIQSGEGVLSLQVLQDKIIDLNNTLEEQHYMNDNQQELIQQLRQEVALLRQLVGPTEQTDQPMSSSTQTDQSTSMSTQTDQPTSDTTNTPETTTPIPTTDSTVPTDIYTTETSSTTDPATLVISIPDERCRYGNLLLPEGSGQSFYPNLTGIIHRISIGLNIPGVQQFKLQVFDGIPDSTFLGESPIYDMTGNQFFDFYFESATITLTANRLYSWRLVPLQDEDISGWNCDPDSIPGSGYYYDSERSQPMFPLALDFRFKLYLLVSDI